MFCQGTTHPCSIDASNSIANALLHPRPVEVVASALRVTTPQRTLPTLRRLAMPFSSAIHPPLMKSSTKAITVPCSMDHRLQYPLPLLAQCARKLPRSGSINTAASVVAPSASKSTANAFKTPHIVEPIVAAPIAKTMRHRNPHRRIMPS